MIWLNINGLRSQLWLIIILLSSISHNTFAQEYADPEKYLIDSLNFDDLLDVDVQLIKEQIEIFHTTESDSTKVTILGEIVFGLRNEVWVKYNKVLYEFLRIQLKDPELSESEKYFYKSNLAGTINNMGFAANAEGNAFMAVEYYMSSSKIFQSISDSSGMALTYINSATAYNNAGELELSNEMDLKGIEIARDLNDMKILSVGYKNISMKLFNAEHYEEALENSRISLKYARLIPEDPVAEAVSLMGIGQIYSAMKEDSLASSNFLKALEIKKEHATESSYYSSLGVYAEHLRKSLNRIPKDSEYFIIIKDSTERCLFRTLEASKKNKQKNVLIRSYTELSRFYFSFDDYKNALHYSNFAYESVNETSNLTKKASVTKIRYQILKALGRHKEALEMLEESLEASEKLNYNDAVEVTARNRVKLEYSVKAAADSVKYAEEQKLHLKEIEFQNEQINADTRQKWMLYSGLGLIAIFSFFLFRKFKQTQQQNVLIEDQKSRIEEVHEEITSSIEYAKRIQTAILPPAETMSQVIPKHFIYYEPKDIVAGDFYWFEHIEDLALLAVADCTGHGVPGAMVSVVCHNAMNRAVREFELKDTNLILDKTREVVIETLAKHNKEVKDGMDIALLRWFEKERKVQFSGANNPLWIIRKTEFLSDTEKELKSTILQEDFSLIELKADKQPIGLYEGMKEFSKNEIQVMEGDTFYLFTDGYADQFGGEKGKKMKYKPFKHLLLEIHTESVKEQKEKLSIAFSDWKGDHEQVDDVCVIGIVFD